MFDRGYIKDLARRRLGYGGQGSAIAVLMIAMLLGAVDGAVKLRIHYRVEDNTVELGGMLLHWLSVLMPLFITLSALALLLGILISNVLRVGVRGWFLRYWRGDEPPVGEMFAGFRFYGNALATMLLRDVFIFLWSLLFVIPGIVMTYAYSMTEYILYENPRLSAGEAIRMSKIMTQGYKGELFVFDLSFLLWHLLSGLTLGIVGIVYVNPYLYTAHAGMYEALKNAAIQSGRLRWEDFGQFPPAPPSQAAPGYGW